MARRAPVRHTLSAAQLAAAGLAWVDEAGRHHSEGHRQFGRITRWEAGQGNRGTLDLLVAQLTAAHAEVTPAAISAILNRRRAPSLTMAGAIERVFHVAAGAWSVARKLGVDSEFSTTADDSGNGEEPAANAAE